MTNLSKKINFVLLGLLALVITSGLLFYSTIYSDAMEVTSIDGNVIELTDANGFTWEYIDDPEDLFVGDIVAVTMSDMFTDVIFNDVILNVRYSGYWME